MSNADNINVFEQIQTLCKDFRRKLKQGESARIEDYLENVGDASEQNLFQNLLHIEIEFRRRQSQNPRSDDYISRFPKFAQSIRQAFFESTMMSREMLEDTPDDLPTMQFLGMPAARRLGEYELRRTLGHGGFGVVYEARHIQRNDLVALKTLPMRGDGQEQSNRDAERLHKFRREFRALSDVNHPNLVGMQSLEVDADQWFLTMDLIDGVDFISYVCPHLRLDEDRLRAALPQLVSGIMALHSEHIIHRDVKPSNVMVTEDGHVLVLDFGLVAETSHTPIGATANLSKNFAGTPHYAAPEQMSGSRTAASDWYAVGVMLYEALAGELPYQGTSIEVLTKKTMEDPPTLIGRAGIAADLAELAMRLLARMPEERPDSLEIARVISASLPTGSSSKSSEQILVGRDTHLQSMQKAFDSFVSGQTATTLFVEGKSGEGKTTLVEYFLNGLRDSSEVVVLSGRCYDRESLPFKALDSLIDPLCNWLSSQKDQATAYLPDDIHMLAQLFPVMRRVDMVATAATRPVGRIDMKQVRHRAFVALREMLSRISQQHSVVLFIDDLQWGDADSAQTIFDLLKPPDSPNVMLLGTYRSDEADEAPFLQSWRARRGGEDLADHLVSLGPLSLEECVELVVKRMREDTESLRQRAAAIFEATGGNPYFLDQLIEGLETGIDTFQAVPLHEIIDRKLQQLPETAGQLLELVALSGHAVLLEEISQAAEESAAAVATLTHMRTERLVRLIDIGDRQLVDTYHDKIREVTIDRLESEEKRGLHKTLGVTIERLEGMANEFSEIISPRVYDLAYHFDAAGNVPKTLHYSIIAAESAKDQFALEVAVQHYTMAVRHKSHADVAEQFRLMSGYGETLLLAGRYQDAEKQLALATQLTDDPLERARTEAMLAETVYKTRSLSEAIEAYYGVIGRLGVRIPKTTFGKCLSLLWNMAVCFACRIRSEKRNARRPPPDQQASLLLRVLMGVAYPTYFHSTIQHLWIGYHMQRRALRHPRDSVPPFTVSGATGLSLPYCLGLYSIGKRDRLAAKQAAEELDDLALLALETRGHGYAQLAVGRFPESLQSLNEAITLLETRVADAWQLTMARFWQTNVHFRLGNLAGSIQQARDTFELANRFSQHRLAQFSLYIWTRATDARLPFSELRECIQVDSSDHVGAVQLSMAEAFSHLRHKHPADAVVAAKQAVGVFRRESILNQETVGCLPLLARALRSHGESLQATDPKRAKQLIRRAIKVARKATRYTYFLRLEYPFALREYALALAAEGRLRRAYKFATKSCRIAEEQQASYELAQSRLVQAQLAEQLGRPDADEQIKTAQAVLAEFQQMIESASNGTGRQTAESASG